MKAAVISCTVSRNYRCCAHYIDLRWRLTCLFISYCILNVRTCFRFFLCMKLNHYQIYWKYDAINQIFFFYHFSLKFMHKKKSLWKWTKCILLMWRRQRDIFIASTLSHASDQYKTITKFAIISPYLYFILATW